MEAQEDYSNDALYETLAAYVAEKGVKTGFVMWPIRTAVSGKQMTRQEPLRSWRYLERGVPGADQEGDRTSGGVGQEKKVDLSAGK